MARIIEIERILKPSPEFPIENILVDTNVIINYTNPFGWIRSGLNVETTRYLNILKTHYKVNSTLVSALEYFKYVQVGSYNIFKGTREGHLEEYSTRAFKKLRRENSEFADRWNLRMLSLKRTFRKHFPPYEVSGEPVYSLSLIEDFDGTKVDFGDEVLYRYCLTTDFPIVITFDRDFKSFPDDLHVVFL